MKETYWRKANLEFFRGVLISQGKRKKKLLDIGSGNEPFKDLTRRGFDVTTFDIRQFGNTDIVADLNMKWPVESSTFHVVYMSNTLEHIFNPANVFYESYRVLKRGGLIVGTVPFMKTPHQVPYDYHRYTAYALRDYLKGSNFSEIEIFPISNVFNGFMETLHQITEKYQSEEKKKKLSFKIAKRVIYNAFRFFGKYIQPEISVDFCEGYGFTARKRT